MRICYVVSFFHPFASGASGRRLFKGRSLSNAGISCMSSLARCRDIPSMMKSIKVSLFIAGSRPRRVGRYLA